jgi:DNA-binding NtrC family response regulator
MTTENGRPHILVADDQSDVLEALRLLLKGNGFDVDTTASPGAALAALERRDYDALLLDMNYTRDTTSGKEGLDMLSTLQTLEPNMPVVVMTAWGSIDNAVEAMRRGARDYVEKPWDNARLVSILTTQVELGRALRRAQRLESENRLLRRDNLPRMIAESPKMKPILQLLERIGPSDANVLITGEHGTGKELVAQWLHASSPRNARSFIAVNMGGLSEGVFESELFGHVKGAFTDAKTDRVGRFELADGGTRSAPCRSPSSPSCCACCKPATSSASARPNRDTWTFASFRRRTPTCNWTWRRGDSARTCCSG